MRPKQRHQNFTYLIYLVKNMEDLHFLKQILQTIH